MIANVYLHDYIADTLQCYGELTDVVNKILDYGTQGVYNFEEIANCEPRDGAKRYTVYITNNDYCELMMAYPTNSPRLPLRKILYWFVNNDMFNELDWQPTRKYINKEAQRIKRLIADIVHRLQLLGSKMPDTLRDECNKTINDIEEYFNND